MKSHLIPFLFLSIFVKFSNSYNFLVVAPLFAHSHTTFLAKIADTLAEAGHNVTFLCPVVAQKYRNVKYVKHVKNVVYIEANEELMETAKLMDSGDFSKFWDHDSSIFEVAPSFNFFVKLINMLTSHMHQSAHVLDTLKNDNYDVIIFECFLSLANIIQEYLKIPTALPVLSVTHSTIVSRYIGEPASPSFITEPFTNYPDEMDFVQRFTNTFAAILFKMKIDMPKSEKIGKPGEFLDDEKVYKSVPFIFTNSNPLIDYSRPLISKSILIGGINVDVKKLRSEKVDETWNEILEKRPHNILISFGSLFLSETMPTSYKKNIVNVIKSMPNTTFIWKYESADTEFAGNLPNLIFSKWVPQTAILSDPRLSLFLTHAGLGSVNELSYLGIPSILCPLFADQMRNAKMLARHNGSVEISKYDLASFENLRSAIQKVLHDPTYKNNAEKLALQLENQPVKPKELVVRYASFAAQFGELPALDPPIRQMSFIAYYLIDVIIVTTLSVFIFAYFVFRISKVVVNGLLRVKVKTQ